MSVVIRHYTPADTRPIMDLFYHTVHAINIRDYSAEEVDAWAPVDLDEDGWRQGLANRHTYVADDQGTVVGFGDYEDDGHLNRFFVHKDYQSVGVGTSLLAALEEAAKAQGISRFFAEASITARPFFERRGYAVVREQQVVVRGVTFTNYAVAKLL